MEKEILTPDVFNQFGGTFNYLYSETWMLRYCDHEFVFFYSEIDKNWWIDVTDCQARPIVKTTLPNRLVYVEDLQNFWVVMTGKELEP